MEPIQKRVMAVLTDRIARYYDAIRRCQYTAVTAFIDPSDLERNDQSNIMDFIATLKWRCAPYANIAVENIQLEVHLETTNPYAVGYTFCTARWTFKEHWVRKDDQWFNRNLVPIPR